MIKSMLLAGLGGFVGTCLRFLIGRFANGWMSNGFPLGTLMVNLVGCFLIGLLFGLFEKCNVTSSNLNLLLITGFCGGFTTFSTFSNEVHLMIQSRQWAFCLLYLVCSVFVGVVLVWTGRVLVK